eukprot:5664087-Amphidinium_carterae.1
MMVCSPCRVLLHCKATDRSALRRACESEVSRVHGENVQPPLPYRVNAAQGTRPRVDISINQSYRITESGGSEYEPPKLFPSASEWMFVALKIGMREPFLALGLDAESMLSP